MVGVMSGDVADGISPFGELLVVGGLHQLFEVAHHLVELFDSVRPLLAVEFVEGFGVIAAEVVILDAADLGVASWPDAQLAHPRWAQTSGLIVSGVQLKQQKAAQRRRLHLSLGVERWHQKSKQRKQHDQSGFHGALLFVLCASI